MNIILDTHTLLWFLSNDGKLSEKARKAVENSSNDVFVSIASFWEIAIKLSLSKLVLDIPFERLFDESEKMNISCYAPVIPAKAGIRVFRRFLLSQE